MHAGCNAWSLTYVAVSMTSKLIANAYYYRDFGKKIACSIKTLQSGAMNSTHQPTMRVLDILERLTLTDDGLSLTEVAEAIGSSKSTVFPILKALTERHYIAYDARRMRYSLGVSCAALSGSLNEKNLWLRSVTAIMEEAVEVCDEGCHLSILDGSEMFFIGKVQTKQVMRLDTKVGRRLPASACAVGKSMLCRLEEADVRALYPDGLPSLTPFTITSFDTLMVELERTREQGYGFDDRENNLEAYCCAIDLTYKGKSIAGLSFAVPTSRWSKAKKEAILAQLFHAKAMIERIPAPEGDFLSMPASA